MSDQQTYPKSTSQDTATESIKLPPFSIEAEQAVRVITQAVAAYCNS